MNRQFCFCAWQHIYELIQMIPLILHLSFSSISSVIQEWKWRQACWSGFLFGSLGYIVEWMLDRLLNLCFWWTNFGISDRYMLLWAFSCSALAFSIPDWTLHVHLHGCLKKLHFFWEMCLFKVWEWEGGWNVWTGRSFALDYEMQLQHFNLF